MGVRAVATNGHVLGIATDASACWDKAATAVLIPRGMIESTLKAASRKTESATFRFTPDKEGISIEVTVDNQKIAGRALDGKFPDYAAVVPFAPLSGTPASFNPDLIAHFIAASKACKKYAGCGRYCAMRMETNGESGAIVTLSGLVDGFAVGGVIMPLRDDRYSGERGAQAYLREMLAQAPVKEQEAA